MAEIILKTKDPGKVVGILFEACNYSGSPTLVPSLTGGRPIPYHILSPKINSFSAGLRRRNVVVHEPWQKSWSFKDGHYTPKTP